MQTYTQDATRIMQDVQTRTEHTNQSAVCVAEKETHNMPSNKTDEQTTQSAQQFASDAMSILSAAPAATIASSTSDKPQGTSSANAKTLVSHCDKAKQSFTLDDTQTWTFTRKNGEPTTGTWKEAQSAIRQAVTTTSGTLYLRRPTRGNTKITIYNVTVDPLMGAKAIYNDARDVKRLGAKGMTDGHHKMLANMRLPMQVALAAMDADTRTAFDKWCGEQAA